MEDVTATAMNVAVQAMEPAADASEPPVSEEALLIGRARTDRAAFGELYHMHYGAVAGYLYRRTGDVHATEDLTGEVFLSAMRWMSRFRYRGIPFRAWLMRIATNAANRWARRRRWHARARSNGLPVGGAVAERGPASGADEVERAQACMLSLPVRYQAVLALHYLEGLSVEQVSVILGCRVGTVKSRLHRAREIMRLRLSSRR
jgi:RNA polymerase sigma-70 factor (ECF subfamily)